MANCSKCGKEIPEGTKFCPYCGAAAPIDPSGAGNKVNLDTGNVDGQLKNYFDTKPMDRTPEEVEDAEKNKAMGILAYFGILVLIPIFAAKDSKFARFHSNNGLILCIIEVCLSVLNIINGAIFPLKVETLSDYRAGGRHFFLYYIFAVIYWIAMIAVAVIAIIGIIHAVKGNKKKLPVVGGIEILK